MSSIMFEDITSLSPDEQARFLNGPALQPPAGISSNFDHPPNGTIPSQVALAIFLILTTVSLCGRIYVRFSTRQLFIGDYLLIVIYATNTVSFAYCYRIFSSPGALVHQWDVRMSAITPYLWNLLIASTTHTFSITFTKVVILLEWIRIFAPRGTRNLVFWASHSLIWINIMFCICILVAYNLACTPYRYLWDKFISGNCNRFTTSTDNLLISAVNLITDILAFLIPQKMIWKLQMPTSRKTAASATFAAGILAITAASLRLVMTIISSHSRDFTYNESSVILCSLAESTCAFLVVCIPVLPKAIKNAKASKTISAMHSWVHIDKPRGLRRRSINNIWPRSRHSQSKSSGGQASMEDKEYRIYPSPLLRGESSVDLSMYEHLGSGILRTTHFEAREDYYPNVTHTGYPRQYGLNGIV
ncbi:uncharacterized protein GGS22DRAFT_61896 [Annulohypoxylon maeteangense]|uniref:uncharacterized protein n=1 Tax=Annulohypoxylon maeteangense TaxID=1927788 RepID=UPI002008AAE8|nr:uncharacterized protein GGS22DRAFT_61896 [Annulohypoxylon maeteangense]KAI0888664.1 hypothetical protein GGS22DRAFT_61896 [Annulohypoxylon maeteangense]